MNKYFHIAEAENGWIVTQTSPILEHRQYIAKNALEVNDIIFKLIANINPSKVPQALTLEKSCIKDYDNDKY